MKKVIWPALTLVLVLAGCAANNYQPTPYERSPEYYYQGVSPQNSPEVQGSLPGRHHPALSPVSSLVS
jgi:hypothetical protein